MMHGSWLIRKHGPEENKHTRSQSLEHDLSVAGHKALENWSFPQQSCAKHRLSAIARCYHCSWPKVEQGWRLTGCFSIQSALGKKGITGEKPEPGHESPRRLQQNHVFSIDSGIRVCKLGAKEFQFSWQGESSKFCCCRRMLDSRNRLGAFEASQFLKN